MSRIIGRDILGQNTLKRKEVVVPEWNGVALVRELTGSEAGPISQGAATIRQSVQEGKADAAAAIRWQAETVAAGWINEDGSNVLVNGDLEIFIARCGQSVIERLAKEIRVLSSLQAAEVDGANPVQEAKKNLTATSSDVSGSSSSSP